ncbi:TspO/MBR family protein [Chengkuizengella marina]|uniref:Tryptophan-rich sensory protein n=1 Tax=Chengkuizengella marina TaxID=2507566 RepID=A0A6N9Q3D2_9BACL|nr:TspO/MBR family protein [Chengkuizengella marina]NBI29290.1 tryptophan-rich sensory protein [Chengkuizengella marina]
MKNNRNRRFLVLANIIFYILVLLVNYLANAIPINGKTTGEISAQYPILITPAPYAFAIWGLIYTLLGCFIIYQALPKTSQKPSLQKIGWWFVLSCIFNITWILVWHFEKIGLSVLVMICLLTSLIIIYRRVRFTDASISIVEKICVQIPFSIYLGWISIATIVNISVFLYDVEWSGWGISEVVWSLIMLLFAIILCIIVSYPYKDVGYVLVYIWAFIAIAIKQNDIIIIKIAAYSMIVLLLIYIFKLVYNKSNQH